MKKALALLLALLMVCSTVAITASATDEPGTESWEDVASSLGMNVHVGAVVTAPVLDGVISDGEYSTSVYSEPSEIYNYGTKITEGGLTEYFAHDSEWVYYAIKYQSTSEGVAFMWQYNPFNTFDIYNPAGADNYFFNRISWQARYNSAYGETYKYWNTDYTGSWGPKFSNDCTKRAPYIFNNVPDGAIDEHHCAGGLADGYAVFEAKIAKSYLAYAADCTTEDVRVLPYFTYLHSADAVGTVYTQDQIDALTAAGAEFLPDVGSLGYKFMVLDPVAINVEDMPGYTPFYAGAEAIATPPVQDGVINAGEYSASRKLAPITANKVDFVDLDNYTNFTTEYVAYDADYIYYAYKNDSIYAAQAQFRFRLAHDYIISDTISTHPSHRQLVDPLAQMITVGLESFSVSDAPEGKTAPTEDDIATGHTWGGSQYTPAVVEIKISRAYLAAQMGLDSAADVTKLTYSTYGQDTKWDGNDWTYLHLDHLLTADQITWLQEQGVTTPFGPSTSGDQVSRLFNMIILDEAPATEINLQDWYGATYVGAALGADDAKPVQDGAINVGEYQAEYIVARGSMEEPADGATRFGVPMMLLGDFKQYVAHDADYFYVAFAFSNGKENTRGRLYWNLSFIDSFNVTYTGGSTVADAFKQGENALNAGWNYGAEVKETITTDEETGVSYWEYSERNNAVTSGTAPTMGTDVTLAVGKVAPISLAGTNRQVYEFKVSKAWYAAQVGLESAADVRDLAWVVLGEEINAAASSYTQIGHYIDNMDLVMLGASGLPYTGNGSGHPYDNQSLPLLFILDEAPDAEGEQPRVPAEVVEPMGGIVEPDQPGDGGNTDGGNTDGGNTDGGNTDTNPPATTTEATTTAPATTTAKATTAADTTAAATTAAKKGCKGSISISALVLLPTLAGGALLIKRRKED